MLLQDPTVDAAIVDSLQAHIKEFRAQLAETTISHSLWKDVLQAMAFAAGLLAAFFLMILIP